jgi:hypothetical protein
MTTSLGVVGSAATLANILGGPGATISNVSYTGSKDAAGTFSGGGPIINIDSGIVLDTGRVQDLPGPNTNSASTDFGLPGDPQLDVLANAPTFDASILQFDLTTTASNVKFNYVFSSEEYNTFVGTSFNDAFGFFVNGQNIALVPGTNDPVSVNTINLNTNSQFYRNNGGPTDPFPTSSPIDINQNGLTTVLPASTPVTPGMPIHIKLAIADASDGILDSAVFLEKGSLSNPPPGPGPAFIAYRPFRYTFRSLEQNVPPQGQSLAAGPALTPSYDGLVTIINVGSVDATGPLKASFRDLPPGVELLNATGTDPNTHEPFIEIPISALPANNGVVRIPVKFKNPFNLPLGTFYEAPYFIDISAG